MDSEELLSRMRTLNKKFKNACNQVILLNNQIEHLQVRYDRAVQCNKRSYRYFLRLRLATLEGIRNMFYEYACRRADQLDEMQDQLVQEGVIDSDYDMDDVESDSETHWNSTSTNPEDQSPEGLVISGGGGLNPQEDTLDGGVESETGTSGGYMWPERQTGTSSYEQFSENTLSTQGSSDEETFPAERPDSPESFNGATGVSDESLSARVFAGEDVDIYPRLSPTKPGAAAKAINAIGHKLVNVTTTASVRGNGQVAAQVAEKASAAVHRPTTAELVSENVASGEHLNVKLHFDIGESKDSVLKVRVTQDTSDAPRQAKAARLNNS